MDTKIDEWSLKTSQKYRKLYAAFLILLALW